jgi:predicted transcriptional regulator
VMVRRRSCPIGDENDGWPCCHPHLAEALASSLDEASHRIDRIRSWIVRQALGEWLAEEQLRFEMTLEALKSVDEGRTISHDEALTKIQLRGRERRAA